ncbi:hypothetical protein ACHAXR_000673, partial [Thalassiosira sp. AJA248-18]
MSTDDAPKTLGKDISGKEIAAAVRSELTEKLSSLSLTDSKPGLAV